ncbi:GGDEF domain-containing protein [Alteromonas pelagimontana]|uniref:diguanylate cyclase n=1 Tax=Alteromonas pelagimontana TaxID=1858656 RepID=A0A6M4MEV2_9ALTE|nr:GGDEF domain-containing protein [Alteromonas pelagimontana]QJR81632.1 GGDEF domain-containing protein [Alteromonas pelagimontana]
MNDFRDDPQRVVDKVSSLISESPSTSELVGLRFVLSRAYSALVLHDLALQQADAALNTIDPEAEPWLYHHLALAKAEALDGLGRAQRAEKLARDALVWARQNQETEMQAHALSTMGYLKLTLSATDEALSFFQKGYSLSQRENLRLKPEDFAAMIGLVHEYREEYELAVPYFEQAETYYRQNNIRLELANTLFGLGQAYANTDDVEEGLRLLLESAHLAIDINDVQGAAYSYQAIASALVRQGERDAASSYLEDALTLFAQAKNPFMQIGVLLEQANIALIEGNPATAMTFIDKTEALAKGDSFLPHRIKINEMRSRVFAAKGEFEKAYVLMLENQKANQRLQKEQNGQRLLELKTRFEVEQQQAQNDLLKEQNLRQQTQLQNEQKMQRYSIALVFMLIVICALMFWLYNNGRQHQRRLENLANEDGLTRLKTRRKTLEDVEQQLGLAYRHNDYFSLAILDLDHFKDINDKYGHQVGDDVLRAFGELAVNAFRSTDIIGRIGGEEFLFAFPHTSGDDAEDMLKQFAESVKHIPENINTPQLALSVSIGLVSAASASTSTQLIANADAALYKAKSSGRDKLVVFS